MTIFQLQTTRSLWKTRHQYFISSSSFTLISSVSVALSFIWIPCFLKKEKMFSPETFHLSTISLQYVKVHMQHRDTTQRKYGISETWSWSSFHSLTCWLDHRSCPVHTLAVSPLSMPVSRHIDSLCLCECACVFVIVSHWLQLISADKTLTSCHIPLPYCSIWPSFIYAPRHTHTYIEQTSALSQLFWLQDGSSLCGELHRHGNWWQLFMRRHTCAMLWVTMFRTGVVRHVVNSVLIQQENDDLG